MYVDKFAVEKADQPAIIMAESGEILTYKQFDQQTNRVAHLLRSQGLNRLDHYSVFMENSIHYAEICGAGERAGLYYTCINSYLTADELAYIINNSESQIVFTSSSKSKTLAEALKQCPNVRQCYVIDGMDQDLAEALPSDLFSDYRAAIAPHPTTPIADEYLGTAMLYSSGTTGRPKGILRPLEELPPSESLAMMTFLKNLWQYREGMIYLSPAPLYHSAPQAAVGLTLRAGGTAVIMEKFDAEKYLDYVSQYSITHSQLVPTMFSRMLKLPEDVRAKADLSSLEIAIHAAAPCPAKVKEDMINWWGPIINEYYGATEGLGFTACNSEEWLAHRGSVGKVIMGDISVLDEDGKPSPKGEPGEIWFKTANAFSYFNDDEKTQEVTSDDGTMSTVGDVGYLDDDGFLYLTDRSTFMIISGGVNIYPQETEDLLITHPKIADAAVFGVPNEDFGEEVKAVIQTMPGIDENEDLVLELMAYCSENLSAQKCPRSIDFEAELPRLPTGKLYKRVLKDKYWADKKNKILG
jgi:long-chain acyl-CoA synthetase